ncbi:MAG: DUF1295 domain-containing protein [Spirochaetes bacterium]|nr:DUF1295 domain-containing protein [Spirochaetota bacterium]
MSTTLSITITICGCAILLSFITGLLTRNCSTVDRLWSILPPAYVLVWMKDFYHNPRFVIAAALVIAWGIRLSWNFGRRGGYAFSIKRGFIGEDYRWEHLRKRIPNRIAFELFNLFFISIYQLSLIFFFTLPLYIVGINDRPLGHLDIILFAAQASFLALETVADNQLFSFHRARKKPMHAGVKRYQAGFNTFGLWRYSRHPNYVCEMAQWVVVYAYAVSASGTLHWSGVGCLVLILLFIGSTVMTESITASKYPLYRMWQKACSPWLPFVDMIFRRNARRKFWKALD